MHAADRFVQVVKTQLPTASAAWLGANDLVLADDDRTPPYLRNTLWVMCFNKTMAGGVLVGAEIYRRNIRKANEPFERMCEMLTETCADGSLCRRWCKWETKFAGRDAARTERAIYCELYRDHIAPFQGKAPMSVLALRNEADLYLKDLTLSDVLEKSTHFVWAGEPRFGNISFLRFMDNE